MRLRLFTEGISPASVPLTADDARAGLAAVPGALPPDTAATPAPSLRAAAEPPSLPPPPASQIAQATLARPEGATELMLQPEELGAVRIEMRGEGERISLHISAERGETLDLIRRHAERLSEELRGAGFSEIHLGFGSSWRGAGKETGADPSRAAPAAPADRLTDLPLPPPPPPQGRLYMRV